MMAKTLLCIHTMNFNRTQYFLFSFFAFFLSFLLGCANHRRQILSAARIHTAKDRKWLIKHIALARTITRTHYFPCHDCNIEHVYVYHRERRLRFQYMKFKLGREQSIRELVNFEMFTFMARGGVHFLHARYIQSIKHEQSHHTILPFRIYKISI